MTRKSLVKAADRAFSRYIVARDKRCVTCGSVGPLDCSHIIRKSRGHFTRWLPDNALAQCRSCHMENHNVSEMRLLAAATERLGAARLEELRVSSRTITQFKDYQLVELARYFTAKADALNGRGT